MEAYAISRLRLGAQLLERGKEVLKGSHVKAAEPNYDEVDLCDHNVPMSVMT